jgi:hypothetical protein
MSTHPHIPDGLASLSDETLKSTLESLEEEESLLSRRRRLLHKRIDQAQTRQTDPPDRRRDVLAELQEDESQLSERRLHLHRRIAELRIEIGDRSRRFRANLTLAP